MPLYLYGLDDLAKYDNDFKSIMFSKDSANDAFMAIKSYEKLKNSELLESNDFYALRLGWDGYAVFDCRNSRFFLNKVMKYDKSKISFDTENIILNKISGDKDLLQIATYAVDTCTFLFLKNGNKCLMGHFNTGALAKAYEYILNEIRASDAVTGVISIIESPQEKNFLNKIRSSYPKINFLNRGEVDFSGYKSHFEIGVCVSGSEVNVFGDLTQRTADSDNQPVEQLCLKIN